MNKKQYISPKTVATTMDLSTMIALSLTKGESNETVGGSDALTRQGWSSENWVGDDNE